ncbi:DUF5682 family protein [Bacillus sp. FJAT-52991]|uniref:DUF5682 family protein n=1 Tax=Bacillus kandeliae TaxID=3129297 RepID=A0ABZ2NBE1_9BACI
MERVLQGEEMDQINALYDQALNYNGKTIYFPVRHHSPACSYHLQKVIKTYQPEVILIEGPTDANKLIPYLVHENNQAPFTIYYSYADQEALLDDEKGKYTCYYPFLDYSPEIVALRQAQKLGIEAKFIDLPYEQILLHSEQGKGIHEKYSKKNYNDDYLFDRSRFIQSLCQKENCRTFNELWEKLYEVDGIYQSTEVFVKNMLAYCYLSRHDYTEEMLKEEGCLAREQFMAQEIQQAMNKYERVLVVTGGFHTPGLIELQSEPLPKLSLKKVKEKDKGTYLMAYTYKECHQLNGYASGMPYPSYYQTVWRHISKRTKQPFEASVQYYIAKFGKKLREIEDGVSTADSIEAMRMAIGLAGLRDKVECSLYELLDGVKSAFTKHEHQQPLQALDPLLVGHQIGLIKETLDMPPIVTDFQSICKKYKLHIQTVQKQEKVLDLLKTKSHREISRFFHAMAYLNTDFCFKKKGPNYVKRMDTNLVRETWEYCWNPTVETELIQHSVYGGTINEAVSERIMDTIKRNSNESNAACEQLVYAALIGLEPLMKKVLPAVEQIIQQDGDFYSLVDACHHLHFLVKESYLFDIEQSPYIKSLLIQAFQKAVSLVTGVANVPKDDENRAVEAMKEFYTLIIDRDLPLQTELFLVQLKEILAAKEQNPAIAGAVVSMLIGLEEWTEEQAVDKTMSYLFATGDAITEAAAFLKGLFSVSRDMMLSNQMLLDGIQHMLGEISYDMFLNVLPELRYAFSSFNPLEINMIATRVAHLHETNVDSVLESQAIDEAVIRHAKALDDEARQQLLDWAILK